MHHTDKYSQHSSIIWPVWLNRSVFVYELSDSGFEFNCSHLIACFKKQKITSFLHYEKRNTEEVVPYNETPSPWNKPRCSARSNSKFHKQD